VTDNLEEASENAAAISNLCRGKELCLEWWSYSHTLQLWNLLQLY
jgi:hypothetical protein